MSSIAEKSQLPRASAAPAQTAPTNSQQNRTAAPGSAASSNGRDIKLLSNNTPVRSKPEQAFIRIQLLRKDTGQLEYFKIPTTQLPKKEETKFLRAAEESSQNRVKLCHPGEKEPSTYLVINLAKTEIAGMKRREFYSRFGKSLPECITTFFNSNRQENLFKVVHQTESKRTPKKREVELTPAKLNNERSFLTHLMLPGSPAKKTYPIEIDSMLESFRKDLSETIKQTARDISPLEPMHLLWHSLCQCTIEAGPADKQLKRKITHTLLLHWEKVCDNMMMMCCYAHCFQYDHANTFREMAIEQLASLQSTLKEANITDPSMDSALLNIQGPLLKLLTSAGSLKTLEAQGEFYIRFDYFSFKKLKDWNHCTISTDNSRRLQRRWLQRRTESLGFYLDVLSMLPIECPAERIKFGRQIQNELFEKNWPQAHQHLKSFANQLMHDGRNLTAKIRMIPFQPFEKKVPATAFIRFFHCIRALLEEFETLISQGKLFQTISEAASNDLYNAYKVLCEDQHQQPSSNNTCMEWAKELASCNYPELLEALASLELNRISLNQANENLVSNEALHKVFPALFEAIQTENYEQIPILYLQATRLLANHYQEWEKGLRQLNDNICQIQSTSFLLMLPHPGLPTIELEDLRSFFCSFNDYIIAEFKPLATFLNAFQQLICFDDPSLSKSFQKECEIGLQFTSEGSFTLCLFQTDEEYFTQLSIPIEEFRASPEKNIILEVEEIKVEEAVEKGSIETVTPAIDEPMKKNASEPISEEQRIKRTPRTSGRTRATASRRKATQQKKHVETQPAKPFPHLPLKEPIQEHLASSIEAIFQGETKSRKIEKQLVQLIKECNIPLRTQYGIGDHKKLYINGRPIILPAHREWKPGTARSIQNEVLKQLQAAIELENKQTI